MNLFAILCFVVWLYLLTVFYRAKLGFFQFVWGSVGLFVFLCLWLRPLVTTPLMRLIASTSGVLGQLTGFYQAYQEYSILFVRTAGGSISLYIDTECAGIIEMMAFVSMMMFFQVYDKGQRIVMSILGCVSIFLANILRIFVICTTVYLGGSSLYYIAHTIIGRGVFYAISIYIYYLAFTKAQIVRQKIGGFRYEGNS